MKNDDANREPTMRDRYEGRPRGHSFGATYSGITATNRPVLEAFPTEWTEEFAARGHVKEQTGMKGSSVSACIRSLIRHGFIEQRPIAVGPAGNWLGKEVRRKPD